MKKLNEFINEKTKLGIFTGGRLPEISNWIATSKDPYKDANGCTVTTTDSFNDVNYDGVYNTGESATACTSISCP